MGFGTHLGWAFGLFLAGAFENILGWRFGFYLTAGTTMLIACINAWKLPADPIREPVTWNAFKRTVDWTGVLLSSACLGMFSYIFA
jgi:predicted MFS family arabinose efflux permease